MKFSLNTLMYILDLLVYALHNHADRTLVKANQAVEKASSLMDTADFHIEEAERARRVAHTLDGLSQ